MRRRLKNRKEMQELHARLLRERNQETFNRRDAALAAWKQRSQPDSVFMRSLTQERHPLDRKFRCGFDPLNVTIKQYRMHITNCKDRDCIGRLLRWLDLMEYFR